MTKILGVDVGGTGIKAGIVDTKKGELLTERFKLPTPQPPTPTSIVETIAELVDHVNWKGNIGCGFPAAIKDNVVMTASNINKSCIGTEPAKDIKRLTGCDAIVLNDVDAAGYAEMTFGNPRNKKGTVLVVAFGTGIGTALYTNGNLVPNTELGHLHLKKNGVAERYTSSLVKKKEDLNWEEFGCRVNEYLSYLEFLFWPNTIIIGGGVSRKYDSFKKYINLKCNVAPAEFQNNAGVIGSALYAGMYLGMQ